MTRTQNTNPYGLAERELADSSLIGIMTIIGDGGYDIAVRRMAEAIKGNHVRHPEQDALFHKMQAQTRNKHALLAKIQRALRGEG